MEPSGELANTVWFVGVIAALVVLFAAGLRLPVPPIGPSRWLVRGAIVGAAVGAIVLANMALYRHDGHLDVTHEKAFTPSPEAQQIVRGLRQTVALSYFYQTQDPAGRATRALLNLWARLNPALRVETIDTDQNPAARTVSWKRAIFSAQNRTSSGASETELNALTVMA